MITLSFHLLIEYKSEADFSTTISFRISQVYPRASHHGHSAVSRGMISGTCSDDLRLFCSIYDNMFDVQCKTISLLLNSFLGFGIEWIRRKNIMEK